jgi:hypothetical protein
VCVAAAGLLSSAARGYAVSINVGSAGGAAGTPVQIAVTLSTTNMAVAGTANDIVFDPLTPIVNCTVNPAFAGFSAAVLLPDNCTPGVDCQMARILIIRFPPIPIADGATLYTCDVDISAGAPAGSYTLACLRPGASDPDGMALPVQCLDAQVTVGPGDESILVCDVAPSRGDALGQFGNGIVNGSDVVAIFRASLLGPPAASSARFNAMDSVTVDNPPTCGGDNGIKNTDVVACFKRSLILTEPNYWRTSDGTTCTSVAEVRQ